MRGNGSVQKHFVGSPFNGLSSLAPMDHAPIRGSKPTGHPFVLDNDKLVILGHLRSIPRAIATAPGKLATFSAKTRQINFSNLKVL